MDAEGGRGRERRRDDADPLVRGSGIDVDHAEHVVLGVGEQVLVLGLEPAEVVEPLQRRQGAPSLVQLPHQRQERAVERTLLHLVLLRVEVLLGARLDGHALERLEPGIDPVRGRERRGEHEPRLEGGRAAVLEVGVQDVGCVREHVGTVVVRPAEHLVHELLELRLGVLPGEVGVALGEPGLRERRHQRGPGERLGQEEHLRVAGAHLPDQPLPERDGLRVRVVDAEDGDAPVDPLQDDVAERPPEGAATGRVEVDVVDVLVALRRVLGVLQGAVGAAVEPLRMLGQPRVIGRALDGEVERDLESCRLRRGDHGVEVVRACRARGSARRDRPPSTRSPRASRRRRAPRARRCSAPCGSSRRSGAPAGGRRRRSRARRAAAAPPRRRGSRRRSGERARTRSRSGPARGRRRPRALADSTSANRSPAVGGEALLDGQLVTPEERRALGELAGEVGLTSGLLAPQLVLPGRDAVGPGETVNDQSPGASTANVPP